MYALFFRSFYLVIAGMFGLLFFACVAVVLAAARAGDTPSTIVGVGVATLCAMLVKRAVRYMRE
jgi:hypothetical protein